MIKEELKSSQEGLKSTVNGIPVLCESACKGLQVKLVCRFKEQCFLDHIITWVCFIVGAFN